MKKPGNLNTFPPWYFFTFGLISPLIGIAFIMTNQIGASIALTFVGLISSATGVAVREMSKRLDRLEENQRKANGADSSP